MKASKPKTLQVSTICTAPNLPWMDEAAMARQYKRDILESVRSRMIEEGYSEEEANATVKALEPAIITSVKKIG